MLCTENIINVFPCQKGQLYINLSCFEEGSSKSQPKNKILDVKNISA